MLTAPFDTGHFGFLAWNYEEAAPAGTLDGGWNSVLGLTVSAVARPSAPVPEPSPSTLLVLGLLVPGIMTVFKRDGWKPSVKGDTNARVFVNGSGASPCCRVERPLLSRAR